MTMAEWNKPFMVGSDHDHAIAMTVPCRNCGAAVGQLCVRHGGRTMLHHIHRSRRVTLRSIYIRKLRNESSVDSNR